MHDFRTVQTTTIVGGGKQFSNSKSHIREENPNDRPLPSDVPRRFVPVILISPFPFHRQVVVAILVAIGIMVVSLFSLATYGAFSVVSSTAEYVPLMFSPHSVAVFIRF